MIQFRFSGFLFSLMTVSDQTLVNKLKGEIICIQLLNLDSMHVNRGVHRGSSPSEFKLPRFIHSKPFRWTPLNYVHRPSRGLSVSWKPFFAPQTWYNGSQKSLFYSNFLGILALPCVRTYDYLCTTDIWKYSSRIYYRIQQSWRKINFGFKKMQKIEVL